MIFRKPIDSDRDLTEEERAEKLERFRSNDFDDNDEKAMIWAALKVFVPAFLGVAAVFVLVAYLLMLLWKL